jgi:hypothetical protein
LTRRPGRWRTQPLIFVLLTSNRSHPGAQGRG